MTLSQQQWLVLTACALLAFVGIVTSEWEITVELTALLARAMIAISPIVAALALFAGLAAVVMHQRRQDGSA